VKEVSSKGNIHQGKSQKGIRMANKTKGIHYTKSDTTPQTSFTSREELLRRVQQYETEYINAMTTDTLLQTGFLSEHELVADVMNAVTLQSTQDIWNHYGSFIEGYERIDQRKEADYGKENSE